MNLATLELVNRDIEMDAQCKLKAKLQNAGKGGEAKDIDCAGETAATPEEDRELVCLIQVNRPLLSHSMFLISCKHKASQHFLSSAFSFSYSIKQRISKYTKSKYAMTRKKYLKIT